MRKKDIYIQDDASSCGARCIQSIVSHYGGYVPLETVLEDTNTTMTGTNAYEMVLALETYGFEVGGYKVDYDSLCEFTLPLIAHTVRGGYEHFIVIYEITPNEVITMDPEFGEKRYSIQEFKSIFSSSIISIKPKGEIPKYKRSTSLVNMLKNYLEDSISSLTIVFILSIAAIILSILVSFHLKSMNTGIDPIEITIFFIILEGIIISFRYVKELVVEIIIKRISEETIDNFTRHIFSLPLRYIKNKRVGEIVKKIEDIAFIKDLFIRIIVVNTIDLFAIVASLIVMVWMSPSLASIYFLILIIYSIVTLLTRNRIYKDEKDNLKLYNDYSGTLVEYIGGIESIKNLNSEKHFLDKLSEAFKKYAKGNALKNRRQICISSIKNMTLEVGVLLANLYGFMNITNSFTFIDLMTYTSIFSIFYESCTNILDTFVYFTKCKAIFRNTNEFNDLSEEIGGLELNRPIEKIKMIGFTYSYNRIDTIIKDFSCSIHMGDKIFLSGPSGVGKSTLVKALVGLSNRYEGIITINDIDLEDLSTREVKKRCIYVGQEEKLFSGSFKDNILMGIESEDYESVLAITRVDEIIKAHGGDEAIILEGGVNLSGGEKARIILARALVRNPECLIIDECLSSVPEAMENDILGELLKIENMILIYISHRNKEEKFEKVIEFRKDKTYEIRERKFSRN